MIGVYSFEAFLSTKNVQVPLGENAQKFYATEIGLTQLAD
jgi:hypothetical protein